MQDPNINPVDYPNFARQYASLSPDEYCWTHLENWLEEHGRSLKSYRYWLEFRLLTDRLPISSII